MQLFFQGCDWCGIPSLGALPLVLRLNERQAALNATCTLLP